MNRAEPLTDLERLDLHLMMLVSHQKRLGAALEILRPSQAGENFKPQVETSHRMLQEIRRLCSEPELLSASREVSNQELRGLRLSSDQIEELDESLRRAENLAWSLGQLPFISLDQFDSFGFFVCYWIERFRGSGGYASWRRFSRTEKRVGPLRPRLRKALGDNGHQQRLEESFGEMLYVLCLIRFTQNQLHVESDPRRLIAMMVRCNDCSLKILDRLAGLAAPLKSRREELGDLLSWSSGALKMETKKVLADELHHLDAEVDLQQCRDRLDRAVGVLLNGFDQTLRHLLRSVDPELDGLEVLEDLEEKYRQSCRLREMLQHMKKLSQSFEAGTDIESMEYLRDLLEDSECSGPGAFYRRDRRVLEEFAQRLERSEGEERRQVAHQMETFLAALLNEVDNRGIFSHFEPSIGHPFQPPPASSEARSATGQVM